MGKRLKITIPKNGIGTGKAQIKVEAIGMTGPACSLIAQQMAEVFGSVSEEEVKDEYFSPPQVEETGTVDGTM